MSSVAAPLLRIPVGIVVERRKATSPWIDYIWRPSAVLPDIPGVEPWTVMREADAATSFYAGGAEVELHRSDAHLYRDNLLTGTPLLWVIMSPTEGDTPFGVTAVTADPAEGEGYAEVPSYLVEPVPMPEVVRIAVEQFVAHHYVDQDFVKRQRDRANPEALARRQPGGHDE